MVSAWGATPGFTLHLASSKNIWLLTGIYKSTDMNVMTYTDCSMRYYQSFRRARACKSFPSWEINLSFINHRVVHYKDKGLCLCTWLYYNYYIQLTLLIRTLENEHLQSCIIWTKHLIIYGLKVSLSMLMTSKVFIYNENTLGWGIHRFHCLATLLWGYLSCYLQERTLPQQN